MAEIMSKINIFFNNGIIHQQNHHHHYRHRHGRVSVIPSNKSTDVSLKPLVLRSSLNSNFCGRRVVTGTTNTRKAAVAGASNARMSIGIRKAQKWWEKELKTNMKEVKGPQDLVESLLNAGDKLVVVDFFSPGCGGCKALHPKICQLAEMNPDVQFLQVNYEEHKSMCYALNVHVLPFFRFYRGAHGRLCSFSCTNATVKKFKDALAKHSPDRCSLGPTKGLEEKELVALAANKELSFTYKPKPEQPVAVPEQEEILRAPASASQVNSHPPLPLPHPLQSKTPTITFEDTKYKTLVTLGT